MDEVDWSSLHKVLSDPTRRSILEVLAEKEALGYTEMMTILGVTNTGRLNYHLKVLGDLLSKDESGMYHLSERGRLAANLLTTFPERVMPDRKPLSALKIAVCVLLILVGTLLIVSGAFALTTFPVSIGTSSQVSVSNLLVPQNATVLLGSYSVPANESPNVAWSATSAIHIYVLNSTQYGDLLLMYSTTSAQPIASVENFTGAPSFWVSQFYLESGNVTLSLSPGQYYFFAGSSSGQTLLDSFQVTQVQQPESASSPISPLTYLLISIPVALGAVLVVLALSIISRRLWR
jgi:DNA-binding transcriptional ArsR family regulator